MKKQILLFIMALVAAIQPAPADDKVFPESDAMWNIHRYINGGYQNSWIYGLSGDTIINEKKYSKLYLLNDTTLHIDHNDTYVGGIREENKQVWFLVHDYQYPEYTIEEYILYDFSRKEGDVFTRENVLIYYYSIPYLEAHLIDNISTEILKIEEIDLNKRFYTINKSWGAGGETIWIEGIGSTKGVTWDLYAFPMNINNVDFKLACFKKEDEVIYLDNEFGGCFCERPSGDAIDSPESHSVLVFVDKESASIKVVANNLPLSFELLNLQGQTLLQEKISSLPQSISYGGLPKGLYLYRITGKDNVIQTGKIRLD